MQKPFGGVIILMTLELAACWDDSRQLLFAGEFNRYPEGGRAGG